jgi:hypothetical protein
VLVTILALAAGACSRSDGDVETGSDTTQATGSTGGTSGGSRLDAAGFGDLENVCQDGDASGATDTGVTDDTIQVGTITDKGFTARPGLNEEMYDTAVAFAAWCNEHGGINGRELVVADRDAALAEYNARIVDACSQDFALVGGGAVLDDSDQGERVRCGLPNIAGYVVSETARSADLQVQPVPNPVGRMSFGPYQVIAERFPDLIDRYGTITSSFGSVVNQRDDTVTAATALGFTPVYQEEYNSQGEPTWRPFVDALQAADVQVLEFVGEPTFYAQLLEQMQTVGYRPAVLIQQSNFYDSTFAANAGGFAENVRVRLQYTPLEMADENPATADYLELMDRYNPDGKVALLGMQAMSSYLLFAQAASACGSELTRTCLLEQASSIDEWRAGGLHAPQHPGANDPSPCFVMLSVSADGFAIDEEATQPTDGIFNCEDDNVVDVPVG